MATNTTGEFVLPNVPPDTYTLEINQKGFKMLKRTGIAVSPGDRVGLGTLTLEVGGTTETVTVTAEAVLLQTQSAERSATIAQIEVKNLPLSSRFFTNLTMIIPGVGGTAANQPGRGYNILFRRQREHHDGRHFHHGYRQQRELISVNTESIEEIKILTSGYQAEYGRSSGVQISAVTKSGTNRFHGTGFLIMRQSGWYANSKTNILNGDPRPYSQQKDLGFTIGGPIGKPGHDNKMFFFYSHELDPRSI